jgi:putative ABC transport system substrate-binding protein
MNGPRTASSAPVGHLHGLRGRFVFVEWAKGACCERSSKRKDVGVKLSQAVLGIILILVLLAVPVASLGQQPAKVYRIGWLATFRYETPPRDCPLKGNLFWQSWIAALRERGYIQGQNLVIECRYTEGRDERAILFASELVSLAPDLIVACGTTQVRATKQATSAIPIVMHCVMEPVRRGLVASLARPGGNVTGLTDSVGVEIYGKYLQLLKEAVPKASRVAALRYSGTAGDPDFARETHREIETEARRLGVQLQFYGVREREELEGVFAAMIKARAEALLVVPHPSFATDAQQIVDLAARCRLPAMYPDKQHVEVGGLMAYAVDLLDTPRRLAEYADRIFKGAKPGDLPVEQPTRFDLIINLKAAKALGLTIPPTLLIQAEEVIR